MEHISIDVSEEIKRILPRTLEKNLRDNEIICPLCRGVGIIKRNQGFGEYKNGSRIDWYDNEYFAWCPNCYFGVVKTCEYCGKQLSKGSYRCNCDQFLENEQEERLIKYKEKIEAAKEIEVTDSFEYLYDNESGNYFFDVDEFAEYYWELYQEDDDYSSISFDEYFEKYVPKILWICMEVKMSIDARDIIDRACEELHEDALDNISDKDTEELQEYLDSWCKRQTGTTTYYPDYREYVRVKKEWFDLCNFYFN